MTSAQNRLQPLSGNKFLLIVLLFVFASCGISKKTTTGNNQNNQQQNQSNNQQQNQDNNQQTGNGNNNNEENEEVKKDEYTISLLLPFQSDRVYIKDLANGDFYFPDETQASIEYYQGALLALDSLDRNGSHFKLNVFDTGGDSSVLKEVLQNDEIGKSDLLVGPFNSNYLKVVANFAKQNKIYLLSPLSTTALFTGTNEYYILGNATQRTHCEHICNYIEKVIKPDQVLLVHRDKSSDNETASYFRNWSDSSARLHFVEVTDSSVIIFKDIKTLLSSDKNNCIVVASNDETFVRNMLKSLNDLSADYQINVFGLPTWNNFKSIPSEYFEHLGVYLTNPLWLNKDGASAKAFEKKYEGKFGMSPSLYSVWGYDQMMYFGVLLERHGVKLDRWITDDKQSFVAERFDFDAVPITGNNEVWYYENKSVNIFKFIAGSWMKQVE